MCLLLVYNLHSDDQVYNNRICIVVGIVLYLTALEATNNFYTPVKIKGVRNLNSREKLLPLAVVSFQTSEANKSQSTFR